MVDSMIDRIREEVGYDAPVYATGGLAPIIIPHCKHAIRIDENLVLKGLHILYKKNH
jgi:type III pantothenate kinase